MCYPRITSYNVCYTKLLRDKLNQKEKNKLKKDFPDAITLSNLKKNGQERVHMEILTTIFDIKKPISEDEGEDA